MNYRRIVKELNVRNVRTVLDYIRKNGLRRFAALFLSKLHPAGKDYKKWYEEHRPSAEELEMQREAEFEVQPLISIIVPTYKTPIPYLQEMIESVRAQSYGKWELCIADGSVDDRFVEEELNRYASEDSRIKVRFLDKNLGIAGNTNEALSLASGEYIGLFDHDDMLTPDALYEVVKALQEESYDILYTDEDKITDDSQDYKKPNFKPDFSMDLFCSNNYITHFFVVKSEIVDKIGGFRSEYDGSQDYDFMFRCIECADSIKHIARILYHWRIHSNSVAGNPESKMYAYEAGRRAIEDHFKRVGMDVQVEHADRLGLYHVIYPIIHNPLISIIIPNKDNIAALSRCIQSIYSRSEYKEFELIIVENGSEQKETFRYYETLTKKHSNVRVIENSNESTYPAAYNRGAEASEGEYLLCIDNNVEMITPAALSELLGCCMRSEVGATGAKLLRCDGTVEHAGVIIGLNGGAECVNTGIGRNDYGYMFRAKVNSNFSAVLVGCMMTPKRLFEQVGGFDPEFFHSYYDVDYCLKLRESGENIVLNTFSQWYDYKAENDKSAEDKKKFQKKWFEVIEAGDPYYNPNFTTREVPFSLE